jgi:hypothetical protein
MARASRARRRAARARRRAARARRRAARAASFDSRLHGLPMHMRSARVWTLAHAAPGRSQYALSCNDDAQNLPLLELTKHSYARTPLLQDMLDPHLAPRFLKRLLSYASSASSHRRYPLRIQASVSPLNEGLRPVLV